MKKVLLSLAALGLAFSANAQVLLNYGFEETDDQEKIQPTNWEGDDEKFTGSNYDAAYTEDFYEGQRSLYATTKGTCETYQRVVSLFNNGLEQEKSYRVSFYAKGSGNMNVCLLKGCYNHDLALQAGTSGKFQDQMYDVTMGKSYKRYTMMFWSPRQQDMHEKRQTLSWLSDEAKQDMMNEEYWSQDFLRFSFNTEGQFYVDNVVIEESTIQGVTFNASESGGSAIYVDFGYAVNVAALAGAKGSKFDKNTVTVLVDDEVADLYSVECQKDGRFVIFTEDEIDPESEVKVSFKNDGKLLYTSDKRPFSFTDETKVVVDFEGEPAVYDENLSAITIDLVPGALISTTPADMSFQIDPATTEFTFTFDNPVYTNDAQFGAPKASLVVDGVAEELTLVSTDESTETLVFKRTSTEPLKNATYQLKVTERSVWGLAGESTILPVTSFEVGTIKLASTTYEEIKNGTFPEAIADNVPQGWTVVTDSEVRNYLEEGTYSGNGRVFAFSNSSVARACYFRTSNNSDKGIGSLTSPAFTLPAGKVEVRALIAGWTGNGVALKVELLKAADLSVYKEATFTTKVTGANAKTGIEFEQAPITMEDCEAGDYIFRVSIASPAESGMTEACCGGFMAYTWDGGGKIDVPVLFADDFAHSGHNVVPKFETGWRCYDTNATNKIDGTNQVQYGTNRANSGGVMDVQGFRGMYLRLPSPDKQFAIYGLGGTEEVDGNTVEAPVLNLPAGQALLTYKIIGWDGSGASTTWFEIFKYDEETDYTSNDARGFIRIEKKCSDKNLSNNSAGEAVTVSQFITIPEDGRYVIKLTAQGQALFGYIKIEQVSSIGTIYIKQVMDAIGAAETEFNTASADANNAGTAVDNLNNYIEECKKTENFHTMAECEYAIQQLDELVKVSKQRRANVADYLGGTMAALKQLLEDNKETKYANLECYAKGLETVAKYDGVAVTSLSDEELAAAVADINNSKKLIENMINSCIGLYTKQIVQLAAKVVALDESLAENEAVLAVNPALKDDQKLAKALKLLYTGTLYKQIAAGKDFFRYYDEGIEDYLPDSLELNCMIQNAQFYCTAQKGDNGFAAKPEDFPGWNIVINSNNIVADWGWGPYECNETRPVNDGAVCTGWGTSNVNVSQLVSDIPVGIYTIGIQVGDGTKKTEDSLSTAYMMVADTIASLKVANDEGARNALTYAFYNVTPDVDAEAKTASYTVGATLMSRGDFSKCDNATLYMTGKVEGFDYAAAADVVLQAAQSKLDKVVDRADAPVAVSYYNLAGQEVAAPKGASLKIERYSDGYTVVKKVLVK
jgi:hypothetical protein